MMPDTVSLGPGHRMATAELVAAIRRFRGRKSKRELASWFGFNESDKALEVINRICRQYELVTLPERERETERVNPEPVQRGNGADLTGETFGRWTVIGKATHRPEGARQSWWICRCSCWQKTERPVAYNNLTQGSSRSCGCLRLEANARKAAAAARG